MEETGTENKGHRPQGATRNQVIVGSLVGATSGVLLGMLFTSLSTVQARYGLGLFLLLPFLMGFVGTLSVGAKRVPTAGQSTWIAVGSIGISMLILLVFGTEGLICITMAIPITVPLAIAGAQLGAGLLRLLHQKFYSSSLYLALPVLPILVLWSARQVPAAEARTETTTVVINAPPEKIWPLLFELDHIKGPMSPLFMAGIAHPDSIWPEGMSVGSSRQCVLSTGVMPEQISAIIPNQLLRFKVLETPPTMREMNPFYKIHAPHLVGYYHCRVGEFRLVPLGPNRTQLIGSSQYDFQIYPAPYWALWTDLIVDQVHLRVMNEIKRRAESQNDTTN